MIKGKIALFHKPGNNFTIREYPVPELKHGEVLVKIKQTTMCGSDIHSISGLRKEPVPTVLGHEICGNVVEVNGNIYDLNAQLLSTGDFVTWVIYAYCGECSFCKKGIFQKCKRLYKYGHMKITGTTIFSGGLAEYCILKPGTGIVKLPGNLHEDEITPVNCATATVCAAFRKAGDIKNKTVLITGGGMLGITACMMAKSGGAAKVFLIDRNVQRTLRALDYGADYVYVLDNEYIHIQHNIHEETSHQGIDIIIETSGKSNSISFCLSALAISGKMILVGTVFPQPRIDIDPEIMVRNLFSFHGIHNYLPGDLKKAVLFIQEYRDKYDLKKLIDDTKFPLHDINEAISYILKYKPIRLAINPFLTG